MSGTIHILFVHAADELYGADRILLEIVRGLDSGRFRATVVLPNDIQYDGSLSRALRDSGASVVHLRLAVLRRKYFTPHGGLLIAWRVIASGVRLARLIRAQRVDVVHSHTAAVLSGAVAARLAGVPHLWHVSEITVRPALVRRALAWLLPRAADRVVAVSRAVRDHLTASGSRAAATEVIYNGIDVGPFMVAKPSPRVREELGIAPDVPVVGMIGRVGSWKGQELLLEAAAHVRRAVPEAWFVLLGGVFDGQTHHFARLQRLAASLSVEDQTIIRDFRNDVPAVLALLDVFVQPSVLPDPFPTTVLEAMAAGKPVVATAHGGPVEMVEDGVTGLLVAPGSAENLAAALVELLRVPARARSMGEEGRRRVLRDFSLEAFRHNYETRYAELAKKRRPGRN